MNHFFKCGHVGSHFCSSHLPRLVQSCSKSEKFILDEFRRSSTGMKKIIAPYKSGMSPVSFATNSPWPREERSLSYAY